MRCTLRFAWHASGLIYISTSSSCLNSISNSLKVLITRLPMYIWNNWVDPAETNDWLGLAVSEWIYVIFLYSNPNYTGHLQLDPCHLRSFVIQKWTGSDSMIVLQVATYSFWIYKFLVGIKFSGMAMLINLKSTIQASLQWLTIKFVTPAMFGLYW